MGILLFWIDFIVSIVLLYNILFGIYVKEKSYRGDYYTKYEKATISQLPTIYQDNLQIET